MKTILFAALLLLAAIPARASVITFDTRAYAGGALASAAGYESTINALVAQPVAGAYGSTTLSNFDNISNNRIFGGTQSNIASLSTFSFATSATGTWSFRAGVDFGWGGALVVDGTVLAWKTTDMWWAGSYGNSGSFSVTVPLAAGNHEVALYGLENCCDGGMQAQFKAPNGAWTIFATADGLAVPTATVIAAQDTGIPEPASLAVLGAGLVGLGLHRLRRRR